MSILILFLLLVFILLLALFSLYLFFQAFYWVVSGVPFVNSKKKVMRVLQEEVRLKPGEIVYDLGCGDGKVISFLAKNNPQVNFLGLELNFSLILIARIFRRLPNVKYQRGNFFKKDLSQADYIFVFLFPELMDELLPKLEKEMKPGAIVVSNSFKFSKKVPFRKIESPNVLESLYFYKF